MKQKMKISGSMEKAGCDEMLAAFLQFMEEENVRLDPALTFAGICLRLGIREEDMECVLLCDFGVSGTDVLDVYRRGVPLYML